ncbi:MAG: helix-turn-helix transcriptional regulator [Elusimicrobia bacterium]|nr:helix-turn-helix transcriptional regulator [Elusimicrobiota bacterium]
MNRKHHDHEELKRKLLGDPETREAYKNELSRLLVSHQIAVLRERSHMTQAELARRLHTKQQVISRMEQDRYKPSLTTLEKVARIFNKKLEIRFV